MHQAVKLACKSDAKLYVIETFELLIIIITSIIMWNIFAGKAIMRPLAFLLLFEFINVNDDRPSNRSTPLHMAARSKNVRLVELLVDKGAGILLCHF